MNHIKNIALTITLLSLYLMFSLPSYAHIMVAQHGSLNIVDDGAFMVISLPISAFENIDDDRDGKLSNEEFTLHRASIINAVQEKITLKDKDGKIALQGIMLSPVTSHHAPQTPASQLVVMGRYTLLYPDSELEYQVELFGETSAEKVIEITATKKHHESEQVVKLSPQKSRVILFNKDQIPLAKR